jgi:hypothetical protein
MQSARVPREVSFKVCQSLVDESPVFKESCGFPMNFGESAQLKGRSMGEKAINRLCFEAAANGL